MRLAIDSYGPATSVTAEDLLVNDGNDGQTVETVRERLPQLDAVSSLACMHSVHAP